MREDDGEQREQEHGRTKRLSLGRQVLLPYIEERSDGCPQSPGHRHEPELRRAQAEDLEHPDRSQRGRPGHPDYLEDDNQCDDAEKRGIAAGVCQPFTDVTQHAHGPVRRANAPEPQHRDQRQDYQPCAEREQVDRSRFHDRVQEAHQRECDREGDLLGDHLPGDRAGQALHTDNRRCGRRPGWLIHCHRPRLRERQQQQDPDVSPAQRLGDHESGYPGADRERCHLAPQQDPAAFEPVGERATDEPEQEHRRATAGRNKAHVEHVAFGEAVLYPENLCEELHRHDEAHRRRARQQEPEVAVCPGASSHAVVWPMRTVPDRACQSRAIATAKLWYG